MTTYPTPDPGANVATPVPDDATDGDLTRDVFAVIDGPASAEKASSAGSTTTGSETARMSGPAARPASASAPTPVASPPTQATVLPARRMFVIALRLVVTGNDPTQVQLDSHGYVVAGPPMSGVIPAGQLPALVQRVALGDSATLGAALLSLPQEYLDRDAARKVEAAARAEANKQRQKEEKAQQRKTAVAAKQKADLIAAAKRSVQPLAPAHTTPPALAPAPNGTPSAPASVPDASRPNVPPTSALAKTTRTTRTSTSTPVQPSLFD